MHWREMAVSGAYEFTPETFEDERGVFVSPFLAEVASSVIGHQFPLAQMSHSRSRTRVIRGVHFTSDPPGQQKYVSCARGRVMDVVVDLRVGSPTFGAWDAVELDDVSFRAIYLPPGVGHAYAALQDDVVMSYMLSRSYEPALEYEINPMDPELGLPWPWLADAVLSERDRDAPTLAEALASGTLPRYAGARSGRGASP